MPETDFLFSKRRPIQINPHSLYDGQFLLTQEARSGVHALIKAEQRKKWFDFPDPACPQQKVYISGEKVAKAFVFRKNLLLGSGAFGRVYLTQNALTGTWHYIKILQSAKLNYLEVRILQAEGQYISHLCSSLEDIVIGELIHGETLQQVIQRRVVSFEQALALNIGLVEALYSLHGKGYVHRDIKPKNILFDHEQQKSFLIDFGLSQKVGKKVDRAGTYHYMSLETLERNPPSFKDDIYAMGLIGGSILSSRMQMDKNNPLTLEHISKERDDYVKAIIDMQKKLEKKTAKHLHDRIFPMVLAATSNGNQDMLSQQEIELSKLLYAMTGIPKERPTIEEILLRLRSIRNKHIEDKMAFFSSQTEYDTVLRGLFTTREWLIEKSLAAYMHLDSFLLRAVDDHVENRPNVMELRKYLYTFIKAISNKNQMLSALEKYFLGEKYHAKMERTRSAIDSSRYQEQDSVAAYFRNFVSLIDAIKQNNQKEFFRCFTVTNINRVDVAHGASPLHWAAATGNINFVRHLIQYGAEVNRPDLRGFMPIHLAAEHGQASVIRILHQAGSHMNIPNYEGWTPAHIAAMRGHLLVINELHTAGANFHPSYHGITPLQIAVQMGHTLLIPLLEDIAYFSQDKDDSLTQSLQYVGTGYTGSVLGRSSYFSPTDGQTSTLHPMAYQADRPPAGAWTASHFRMEKKHTRSTMVSATASAEIKSQTRENIGELLMQDKRQRFSEQEDANMPSFSFQASL